jgi:hypothetical protein
MHDWDDVAWGMLVMAVVIGANAINEARLHHLGTGAILAVVAIGFVGLWRLVRWYAARP